MTDSLQSKAGVLAVLEGGAGGEISTASLEAVGAARTIAEALNVGVDAAIGGVTGPIHTLLGARGVRRVFESRPGARQSEAAWAAIQRCQPLAVVTPATAGGREAAGVVSGRMQSELVSGCTYIAERDGAVQFGRPCLSGRGFAVFAWDRSGPVVVTTEPGAFCLPSASSAASAEVVVLETTTADNPPGVTILSEVAPSADEMDVLDAEVVVAGGAGVGDKAGFTLLAELAEKLGGTVAASRVAVDRGWLPSSRQVGLTGKSISPRVYLAFGISGAPQHIAGIRSAGKVVAINTDARAPILKVADLAVIADLHEVVPALIERLPANGSKGRGG